MTEAEVVCWLGLGWPLPGGKRLRPEIVTGAGCPDGGGASCAWGTK
jgi:hypothetical protein